VLARECSARGGTGSIVQAKGEKTAGAPIPDERNTCL
jgi:hypothetical protein